MAVRGVRSEFAYYVPRILNRTVLAYRTSVQFFKRTVLQFNFSSVPYQRTLPVSLQKKRTVPAYRTSWQKLRRTVPYCHFSFQLLATLTDFEITSL